MNSMNEFRPIYRRYIISMIALVFVDIALICHEINTRIEDQFNGFFGYVICYLQRNNSIDSLRHSIKYDQPG